MASRDSSQYMPSEVSPAGETLADLLEDRRMKQVELATRTGKSPKHISEVVSGEASISPEFALALEMVFLVPAHFWLAREAKYQEFLARRHAAAQAAEQVEWARSFPINDLKRHGLIPSQARGAAVVDALLRFLGIASSGDFKPLALAMQPSFRRSRRLQGSWEALIAWLRWGEILAAHVTTEPYCASKFREVLPEIRALSLLPAEEFVAHLVKVCASAGVAVVFVPELRGTHASGATRWLCPDKALIQLSLRYRTDDMLWFSFFHEACHILRHSKKATIFEDSGQDDDAMEAEADGFAADTLIAPRDYKRFARRHLSGEEVLAFAAQQGIAPGIVVGRLQHDGWLPHTHMNDLKRTLVWADP